MSQMTLEETVVMTMLAKLDGKLDAMHDYNKARFAAIQSTLHAVVLRITDQGAALDTHVLAMEPTVVPNEDEAMPVLASCPCCEHKEATTAEQVEELFGYRTMADGKTIVQSWCRECRGLEGKTSPRKKQRLPDDVRDQGVLGRRFLKKAAAKRDERAKVLEASNGRETKESLALLREEQDLTTQGMAELSGYDTKRAILRKTNGNK
jgi:hypothetical protein